MADLLYDAIVGNTGTQQQATSDQVQPISDEDLNHPLVRSALKYVNAYEGSPKANHLYGYKEFNDLSKHPNVKIPFTDKGDVTTAAGSYQILAPTWEIQAKKQGLKDFSQDSQDRAAIGIMRDIGALDAFKAGDYDKGKQLLGKQWASIPGSTIGKSTGQIPKLDPNKELILPSGDSLYNAIVGNEMPKAEVQAGKNVTTDIPQVVSNKPVTQADKEQQMNWFQKGMNASEASNKLQGAGEAIASLVANPVISTVGAVKGLAQSLPSIATGKAPEIAAQIASDFEKKYGYSPTSEQGKKYLQSIGETFQGLMEKVTGSSMPLPPVIPELTGITTGRAAAGQIEKQFAQAKNAPKPSAKIYDFPSSQAEQPMVGVGAAESSLTNRVQTALNEAPDYLKQSLKDVPVTKLATPENLKAIENHNKFSKFDLIPTEGQALENTSLMSSEFNSRKIDPNLQARFEERDPKLIQAFNNIKEKVSPDVFENDPQRLASMPLDKVKNVHQQKEQNVSNLWNEANMSAGTSQAPIDVGALRENIINGLKEKGRARYVPTALQADLDEVLTKGFITPAEYENFRSDTATIARTNPDPMARQAAYIIRQKLEQVPLKDEFAQYKPKYDAARKATQDLHNFEKSSVVKAAISDTRTPDEIAAGMPHPAAKNFISQHYSAKTPQVDIERMLDLIGRNSPEHQALNKLKINEFKLNSGIVNDKGTISQNALNKQIHEQHKTNLAVMFGQEISKDLQDLADVANLTEPRKGVHSVNVSNTEILRQENAANAAKEAAGNIVAGSAEAVANAKIPFSGTIIRKTFGGYKAGKKAKAAAKAAQEESDKRLSPKAGIKLKDIGK
jgi:muramidase (phage lysozyme)